MTAPVTIVNPDGFPRPRGYSNGVVAEGRTLHVAGQVGWEADGTFASDDMARQFGRALDHVLTVVAAAGGAADRIVSMTVYVTDLDAYVAARHVLGRIWRERFGRHYPAMALVEVVRLLEPRARVEIQAVAVLAGSGDRSGAGREP